MSDDIVKKLLEDLEQDSGREDSLRRMIAGAFEARMRVYTLIVAVIVVAALAAAVWVAILFFRTEAVRDMILYATLFNTCMLVVASVRLFLWQLLLRQGVMREIKRLELRLLELAREAGPARTSPGEQRETCK
jgi:hypothetical protein